MTNFDINARVPEIIAALKPAFPDVFGWQSGGGIVCPQVRIGDNGAYALITDAETDDRTQVAVGYYRADLPDDEIDEGTMVLPEGSIDEAIAMIFALRAREEIFGDFEGGELADVRSFADLHDVCDANMYLERALVYADATYGEGDAAFERKMGLLNMVAEMVDALDTFAVDAPTVN